MTALDIPTDPKQERQPGDFHRTAFGAPRVARADDETKSVVYGRPSGLGKPLDNPHSLIKWKERQLLKGATIVGLGGLDVDDRNALDTMAARCHDAAGSNLAAQRGTLIHLLTEQADRGEQPQPANQLDVPEPLLRHVVDSWVAMCDHFGLTHEAIEAKVIHDDLRVAGSVDRVCHVTKPVELDGWTLNIDDRVVIDIKTGGLTLDNNGRPRYWAAYGPQMFAYTTAIPYDPNAGRWGQRRQWDHAPRHDVALIAHLDLAKAMDGERVVWALWPVDLANAAEGARISAQARDHRPKFGKPTWAPEPAAATVDTQPVAAPTVDDTKRREHLRRVFREQMTGAEQAAFRERNIDADDLDGIEAAINAVMGWTTTIKPVTPTRPAPPPNPQTPDEGIDCDPGTAETLRAAYGDLSACSSAWVGQVTAAAKAAGAGLSMSQRPTMRRFEAGRALVNFALHFVDADTIDTADDMCRAALTIVTGNKPESHAPTSVGALVATLNADEATQFAAVVDDLIEGRRLPIFSGNGCSLVAA